MGFLNDADDVRSSDFLEDIGTEFDVQGLELDWICVAWDANLRRVGDDSLPGRDRGWCYLYLLGLKVMLHGCQDFMTVPMTI